MLVQKVEKMRVILDSKNIKDYKRHQELLIVSIMKYCSNY